MFRLPVTGFEVALRKPTGAEELLLHEKSSSSAELALEFVARVATRVGGESADWSALPVPDFEALLLRLRQATLGDMVRADTSCVTPSCGARVDVWFRIGDYLEHERPRTPGGIDADAESGWFRLRSGAVRFRLPVVADQVATAQSARPERELMRLCIQPAEIGARLRKRVEAAMESMAPPLSRLLQGQCPECRAALTVYFDVQSFVLRELRERAASLYHDVHLLAFHYKWAEETILALPRDRRLCYAEMLRHEGGQA
ncbi:MAG TPA: hypothetical protein VKM93_03220 [Terriglobia bacterium]|nr:hypothetical protein [Terriglobia bacterium]